jgi:hypothetical protein
MSLEFSESLFQEAISEYYTKEIEPSVQKIVQLILADDGEELPAEAKLKIDILCKKAELYYDGEEIIMAIEGELSRQN